MRIKTSEEKAQKMNNLIKFSRQAYLVSTALHSTRMLHSNMSVSIKPPARINHIIDAMEIGDTTKESLHDILLRRQIKNFSKYSKQYEDNLNGIGNNNTHSHTHTHTQDNSLSRIHYFLLFKKKFTLKNYCDKNWKKKIQE